VRAASGHAILDLDLSRRCCGRTALTEDRALVATGSPSAGRTDGRSTSGKATTLVFPGTGWGAARRHPDDGRRDADRSFTASKLTDEELASGMLFPAVTRLREISAAVAAAVIATTRRAPLQTDPDPDLVAQVQQRMWLPEYQEYHL
jgi:malate dehydrogenase (oxaloacetate-decarboxylating)(NADP+)